MMDAGKGDAPLAVSEADKNDGLGPGKLKMPKMKLPKKLLKNKKFGKLAAMLNKTKPGDEWDQLQPCDPLGRITTAKWGMFCDHSAYPLNTICVKNLPADFCRSVRPTTRLPKGYAEAFLYRDPKGSSDPQQPTPISRADLREQESSVRLKKLAQPGIHGGKVLFHSHGYKKGIVNVVPDDGDPCCNRFSCSDQVGKPWCITPMALHRYEATHPNTQLELKCDASVGKCAWLDSYFPAKAKTAASMLFENPAPLPSDIPLLHH